MGISEGIGELKSPNHVGINIAENQSEFMGKVRDCFFKRKER